MHLLEKDLNNVLITFLETSEIEQETAENKRWMAEKFRWDPVGKNLVWFGEIERKLAKLSKTSFTYRSSSYLFYVRK